MKHCSIHNEDYLFDCRLCIQATRELRELGAHNRATRSLPWRIGERTEDRTWIFDTDSMTQAIIEGDDHLERARLIVSAVNTQHSARKVIDIQMKGLIQALKPASGQTHWEVKGIGTFDLE